MFLSIFFVLIASYCAQATEGGGTIYPGGNEDFMLGALPPPGFYLLNYFVYIHAGSFDDARIPQGAPGAGHKISTLTNGVAPDFNLDVIANTFRLVYVSPIKIFGADWGMHAIAPVMSVDASLKLPGGATLFSQNDAGIGDITIDPVVLGWHFGKNFHLIAGLDILLPSGPYDKANAVNVGRNYFELEPALAFTYLHDRGFEASIKLMYDYNFENDATHYQSGQEFHFDYLIGQHYRNWMFGINGQFYQQTTDDEFPGQPSDFDGNKGKAFSIGPAVLYQYKNMAFTLKYQHDTWAENRSECQKIWFRFNYAF
ncbi:MAG: transporter [Syntrophobacter sp.]